CNEKTTEKIQISPPAFSQTHFSEVTPMVDGSAYVSDTDSRLWYVRGNEAVRVHVSGASKDLPELFDLAPALDASAYLTNMAGEGGLWHLIRERAERVVEVEAMDYPKQTSKLSDKGFYALYIAEHKKRKQMEQDATSAAESESEDSEGPSYDY